MGWACPGMTAVSIFSKTMRPLSNSFDFLDHFSGSWRTVGWLCVFLCVGIMFWMKWFFTYIFGLLVHPDMTLSQTKIIGKNSNHKMVSQEENIWAMYASYKVRQMHNQLKVSLQWHAFPVFVKFCVLEWSMWPLLRWMLIDAGSKTTTWREGGSNSRTEGIMWTAEGWCLKCYLDRYCLF